MRLPCDSISSSLGADLTEAETLLVEAYLAKGRNDLAGCVETAKIYRALYMIPHNMTDVKRLKGVLQVDDGIALPADRQEWLFDLAISSYKHDQGLEEDFQRARVASYPGW